MSVFDSNYVNSIAAQNQAQAKAAVQAKADTQVRAAERPQMLAKYRSVIEQALVEFPGVAQQLDIEPYKVSYFGGGPFYLKHSVKVWPFNVWYCIDKAGNIYRMDHLAVYDAWIKEAKAGRAYVKPVERKEAVDWYVTQLRLDIGWTPTYSEVESEMRDRLTPYLKK